MSKMYLRTIQMYDHFLSLIGINSCKIKKLFKKIIYTLILLK